MILNKKTKEKEEKNSHFAFQIFQNNKKATDLPQ